MSKTPTVKHWGLLIPATGEIIFSRCTHDHQTDSSNLVTISGGFRHLQIDTKDENFGKFWIVRLSLRTALVYDFFADWNYSVNKYGKHNVKQIGKRDCPILGYEIVRGDQ
jgi:hypothetical protein